MHEISAYDYLMANFHLSMEDIGDDPTQIHSSFLQIKSLLMQQNSPSLHPIQQTFDASSLLSPRLMLPLHPRLPKISLSMA